MRSVGRFFKGVVASGSLPPDAAQDVVRVNADRRRVFVADGAGDTGASAGDWANVLGLCFSASREAASTRDPEWLRRAVETWSRTSHVRQLAANGEVLNKGEARLLKEGVESSFLAATFSYERELALQWTAAGDCEVMLFRDGRLLRWGPVPTWRDFSSFPGGVGSKGDTGSAFHYDEWPLEVGDVILFATDALACHVLRECETASDIPDSVGRLLSLGDWTAMRVWIETARAAEAGNLENDDVGMIRIRIEQDPYGSGSFALTNDVSARQVALTRDLRLLGPSRSLPRLLTPPPRPIVHPFTDDSAPVVDSVGEPRDIAAGDVHASTAGTRETETPSADAHGEELSSSGPAQAEQEGRVAPPAAWPLRPHAEATPPFSWGTFVAGVVAGIVLIAVAGSVADIIRRDAGDRQTTRAVASATLKPVARGSSATPPPLADEAAPVAAVPAHMPPGPTASPNGQTTRPVANATLKPVARGSSATPPPLADEAAPVAAVPAHVPPGPTASPNGQTTVANATPKPVARGSSATPPPLDEAAPAAAVPAHVPPGPTASSQHPERQNDRPPSRGKPTGAAAAPHPRATASASAQRVATGTTAPTGTTASTGTTAPTDTPAPEPRPSPSSSSPSEGAGEAPTPSPVASAGAEMPTAAPCSLAKKTSLFAADDERRKIPLLVVDAAALPCTPAADAGGQIVLFSAWLWLPGTSDPRTLAWVQDRRLPGATNVWLAPEGDYLGNLKAGTRFTLGDFMQRDDKVWIELRVNAKR